MGTLTPRVVPNLQNLDVVDQRTSPKSSSTFPPSLRSPPSTSPSPTATIVLDPPRNLQDSHARTFVHEFEEDLEERGVDGGGEGGGKKKLRVELAELETEWDFEQDPRCPYNLTKGELRSTLSLYKSDGSRSRNEEEASPSEFSSQTEEKRGGDESSRSSRRCFCSTYSLIYWPYAYLIFTVRRWSLLFLIATTALVSFVHLVPFLRVKSSPDSDLWPFSFAFSTLTASMPVPSLTPMGLELGITNPELLTTSFSIFMLGVGVSRFLAPFLLSRLELTCSLASLSIHDRLALSSSHLSQRSTDVNRSTRRRWSSLRS